MGAAAAGGLSARPAQRDDRPHGRRRLRPLQHQEGGLVPYSAYFGILPDDKRGGYRYGLEDRGLGVIGDIERHGGGGDLRWTAPLEGLQVGVSHMETRGEFNLRSAQVPIPLKVDLTAWNITALYGDYQVRELALQRRMAPHDRRARW